jgi:hypothetical protein
MKKYTCWRKQNSKVKGAIEGSKKEVLAWMRERFPGLKSGASEFMAAWEFFYEGDIDSYVTDEGKTVYLVELVED